MKTKKRNMTALERARERNCQAVIEVLENTSLPTLSPFLDELFRRAGISNVKQQREYSKILETEGIDRAEVLAKLTIESLKVSGMRLIDAVTILEAARAMLPKDDVPIAEAV
jgi:hypothetical protein